MSNWFSAPKNERRPRAAGKPRLGFQPDAVQRRLLDSTSPQVIVNCCRQWGKSTITAAKALQNAYRKPGSLTLILSPSGRQSGEFVRKVKEMLVGQGVEPVGDGGNEMSLQLPNRSRIIGLRGTPARTRGFSAASLLVVDEAAQVDEELYLAMRPVLAVSGGAVWLLSTPYGRRGFFHEAWEHGGGAWERIRVTAEECPRISPEFLKREREQMGERWYRQEYLCEFADVETGVFRREVIDRAIREEVGPLEF